MLRRQCNLGSYGESCAHFVGRSRYYCRESGRKLDFGSPRAGARCNESESDYNACKVHVQRDENDSIQDTLPEPETAKLLQEMNKTDAVVVEGGHALLIDPWICMRGEHVIYRTAVEGELMLIGLPGSMSVVCTVVGLHDSTSTVIGITKPGRAKY